MVMVCEVASDDTDAGALSLTNASDPRLTERAYEAGVARVLCTFSALDEILEAIRRTTSNARG